MLIYVIYARKDEQFELMLEVDQGTTVHEAIIQSGILNRCPEIDLTQQKVGCFSRLCALTSLVKAKDRIEIYRPLTRDPKERRRLKAKK